MNAVYVFFYIASVRLESNGKRNKERKKKEEITGSTREEERVEIKDS